LIYGNLENKGEHLPKNILMLVLQIISERIQILARVTKEPIHLQSPLMIRKGKEEKIEANQPPGSKLNVAIS